MKLSNVIFILYTTILICSSYTVNQSYVQQQNVGIWSDTISQDQSGNAPSQYFLCGFGFRQMKWDINLWNCNCGKRWYSGKRRWRCNWCINTFWTKSNAFKAVFCHYNDWNKQIQKKIQTGNTDSGNWRQFKCPVGQYASKIALKYGNQQGQDLGMNGMSLKCENPFFSISTVVTDNYNFWMSSYSQNKQGNFISSFKIKYQKNNVLRGFNASFQGMPVISKIRMIYTPLVNVQTVPHVVDSVKVMNNGTKTVQRKIQFSKIYEIVNNWNTQNQYIHGYSISATVGTTVSLPMADLNAEITTTTYSQTRQMFGFGKAVKSSFSSTQSILVMIPPCKTTMVNSMIQQRNMNIPYQAELTFNDRWTGKQISTIKIKGVWEGVLTSNTYTQITETKIQGCSAS